ncbi:MAG: exodeoxyribonuclease VII large subunit [Prevotella sp.]|nr:exodeoxyribonuclease VII large subunit [Prevotella sp.]
MHNAISLYELNSLVKEVIETTMSNEYWVEAELSEAHENGGHCYIELIEKDENSNTPIAKARAMVWRNTWNIIKPYFERVAGESLHSGMKVMLKLYPTFHPAYGFSYTVSDIDPTYTLGDMAKRRKYIIIKLKENGLFELNKELEIPMFTQRIAVISSNTAAGYGDFCKHLSENEHHLYFKTELFSATMQGESVESSIINALNQIYERIDDFDIVVITRGGGGTSDFSGFDTYTLAENVAQFPLPIITGIGHERDDTILDLISNVRVKTPTAAAEFLINRLEYVYQKIEDIKFNISNIAERKMEMEKMRLEKVASTIPSLFALIKIRQETHLDIVMQRIYNKMARDINEAKHHLDILTDNIKSLCEKITTNQRHKIEMLEQKTETLDPDKLLKRGYSITLYKGKAVRDAKLLKSGDEITTKLENGTVKSTIK